MEITPKRLYIAIKSLRKRIKEADHPDNHKEAGILIIPIPTRVLSDRYRGKGRPRLSDYDFKGPDMYKKIKKIANSDGFSTGYNHK